MKKLVLAFALAALCAAPASLARAEKGDTSQRLSLQGGAGSAKGHVAGYAKADYRFDLTKGQRFTVTIKSKNPSAYFWLYAPGADDYFFDGQDEYAYSGEAPKSGEYTARVGFMRSEARRGAKADFTLSVKTGD